MVDEKLNPYVICCEPRVVLFGYLTDEVGRARGEGCQEARNPSGRHNGSASEGAD